MNVLTLRYTYWRYRPTGAIYAVKLAERDGARVVIGAVGPLDEGQRQRVPPAMLRRMLPYYRYVAPLARVLDERQDEYEEVTL